MLPFIRQLPVESRMASFCASTERGEVWTYFSTPLRDWRTVQAAKSVMIRRRSRASIDPGDYGCFWLLEDGSGFAMCRKRNKRGDQKRQNTDSHNSPEIWQCA